MDAFAALQATLRPFEPVDDARKAGPRTVVVVPSLNVAQALLDAHRDEIPSLEERWLYILFALRRPFARVIFVSSLPVPEEVLDHYLALMPEVPDARERLEMISVDDDSPRPLAVKVLERPAIVRAIANAAGGRNDGFVMPFNVGDAERELAMTLGIPIYGIDTRFSRYGTKSGGRQLFAAEGVPHPAGIEDIADLEQLRDAILGLRAPSLRAVVAKHDDGVYGDGNVIIGLHDLPPAGTPEEAAALDLRLRALPPEWIAELRGRRGIVEEMVEAEEIRSPSVQVRVLPGGAPRVVSTHDQVLGGPLGQSFVGCRFPADAAYAPAIVAAARRVGDRLAREGAVGRFGVDFVVGRRADGSWSADAVEINLREGGTSHPYGVLWLLTDGRLSEDGASYATGRGEARAYFATDRLHDAAYRGITARALLEAAQSLVYDPATRLGVVFFSLRMLESHGQVGLVAIGADAADANERYLRIVELLDGLASA